MGSHHEERAVTAPETHAALAPVDLVALALGAVAGGEPANDSEQWRPVVGLADRYQVSDAGRVRNARTGYVLSAKPDSLGYPRVLLNYGRSVQRVHRVHRLVLEAFVGPPPQGCEASHRNHVRTDNRLVNLVWESHTANMERSADVGRIGMPRRNGTTRRHLSAAVVAELRAAHAAGRVNFKAEARRLGVHPVTVSRAVRGVNRRSLPGPAPSPGAPRSRSDKLTPADVVEIRTAYAAGVSKRELGRRFGVSGTTIRKIVQWERWRDVGDGQSGEPHPWEHPRK